MLLLRMSLCARICACMCARMCAHMYVYVFVYVCVRAELRSVCGPLSPPSHKIVTPSPHRVKPRCAVQDKCGGCPIMFLDPKEQIKATKRGCRERRSKNVE